VWPKNGQEETKKTGCLADRRRTISYKGTSEGLLRGINGGRKRDENSRLDAINPVNGEAEGEVRHGK